MTSTGASMPVHVPEGVGGLVHEHPEAVDAGAPRPRAAASQAVSTGCTTRSTTTWPAPSSDGSHGTRGLGRSAAHPDRRGVHHEVGRRPRRRPSPTRPPSAAGPRRPRRRAVDHDDVGGAGLGQGGHAAPAPRRRRRARPPAPGRVDAVVDAEGVDEAGPVGVVALEPSVAGTTQFTAPSRARRRQGVARPGATSLVRHGDDEPSSPGPPHPASACGPTGLATSKARYSPVEPDRREGGVVQHRRQRVADRRADHRATRVVPRAGPTTAGRLPPWPWPRSPRARPGWWRRRGGPGVGQHVVQPAARLARSGRRIGVGRRVQRGLDRLAARRGDRRGRQPRDR